MTSYRRETLAHAVVQPDTHAGLWLEKYLENDETGSKDKLVQETTSILSTQTYRDFFERWRKTLVEICGEKHCHEAEVLGRLAVNLGSEAVLETSIALHHTYGVPYIPASALKGLASHYVLKYQDRETWGRNSTAFRIMFGDGTEAGYVTFWDALYVPDSGKNKRALWKDIITVHHGDYYQGVKPAYLNGKEAPPADWDSPVPVPFLTATGRFLIAISGPEEWVEKAFEILELAMDREGIGAKTSSGYGRMSFKARGAGSPSVSARTHTPRDVPAGYERGVVKKFEENKGYGFIQPGKGGPDVFVHASKLEPGLKSLHEKQRVIFKRGPGKKPGDEQALDVRLDT